MMYFSYLRAVNCPPRLDWCEELWFISCFWSSIWPFNSWIFASLLVSNDSMLPIFAWKRLKILYRDIFLIQLFFWSPLFILLETFRCSPCNLYSWVVRLDFDNFFHKMSFMFWHLILNFFAIWSNVKKVSHLCTNGCFCHFKFCHNQ